MNNENLLLKKLFDNPFFNPAAPATLAQRPPWCRGYLFLVRNHLDGFLLCAVASHDIPSLVLYMNFLFFSNYNSSRYGMSPMLYSMSITLYKASCTSPLSGMTDSSSISSQVDTLTLVMAISSCTSSGSSGTS